MAQTSSVPGQVIDLYNLRWNCYFSNLSNIFVDLQNKEALVDVTLSSEGQFIKAHKLVLSACSPYFQKLFELHQIPHTVIVLNNVKFKDLQLIVEFMYRGEVKIADADMDQFLSVGRLLQVKGLCSVDLQEKQKECSKPAKKDEPEPKKRKLEPAPEERVPTPKPQGSDPSPDPSRASRPTQAFMIFANQWRKKLAVEFPKETNKEISLRLGGMWKGLSQDTKDAFYEDASKAIEEHRARNESNVKEPKNRKITANVIKVASKNPQSNTIVPIVEIKQEKDDEVITNG